MTHEHAGSGAGGVPYEVSTIRHDRLLPERVTLSLIDATRISRRDRRGAENAEAENAEATADCRPAAGYMDREETAITSAK
jgi:hypothetical protein